MTDHPTEAGRPAYPPFPPISDGMPVSDGVPARAPARPFHELVESLEAAPGVLARLIEGESRERLARPASDGDWGVIEIVPHLAEWERVIVQWTRRWLRETDPNLQHVDDSLWSIERDYASQDTYTALARFGDDRQELVDVLRALDPVEHDRTAIHPELGRMSMHQFVAWICDHDARYIAQARDALA